MARTRKRVHATVEPQPEAGGATLTPPVWSTRSPRYEPRRILRAVRRRGCCARRWGPSKARARDGRCPINGRWQSRGAQAEMPDPNSTTRWRLP